MDTTNIRSQFPFLMRKFKGKPLAYLDNAATSQKPRVVIDSVVEAYSKHCANTHRGIYDLSVEATDLYEGVREKIKNFINAKSSKEIIFTRNATEAINLVARSLDDQAIKDGDEILLTEMEHHSNIVPWQMLRERLMSSNQRLEIRFIPIDNEGRLDLSSLNKLITKKSKIVSLTLMSNVLGTINPVKKIIKMIRSMNNEVCIMIDAAQAASHMKIDVVDLDCDFLVFSAHKMYGPSGVGVLYGREKLLEEMPPFLGGGDMILSVDFEKTTFNELPWKFEAGTGNIAGVIATGAAIDFIESIGFTRIKKCEMKLTNYALKILSVDSLIKVYGPMDLADRGPVISFNINNIHPHDVASILSDEGVAIRSGHHCAQPLMKVLGIPAVCRASYAIYNTKEEINRLVEGIEKVKEVFGLSSNRVIRRKR
ncbi:hypothetical protein A2164_03550 [Candidatus Curtissbacteria bacterium RBG_13_35_7]|uniref:Cysteine desulfurase n=1 Tax=Candidatus Curtissbacteria bacterium RBG_13_35_7 TaxID=1797705 RepID=A0A1F5G4A1_9BACT|nr:MAG: hypothetical protein A2164_03550 [Candidatus Curtissbacteria bacterium RBG_13_35_7]